jgi:plastocyanin
MNKYILNNLLPVLVMLGISGTSLIAGDLKGKVIYDNEALANAVISLQPLEDVKFPASTDTVVMDQVNLRFVPHVLPVMVGAKVLFPNSDKIRHSVFSPSEINKFDFGTYPPGSEKSIICNKPGVISVLCYIHHDMSAYIVVLEAPFFALSDESGEYSIKNIPAGKYKLTFWHEEFEKESEVIVISQPGVVINNITVED